PRRERADGVRRALVPRAPARRPRPGVLGAGPRPFAVPPRGPGAAPRRAPPRARRARDRAAVPPRRGPRRCARRAPAARRASRAPSRRHASPQHQGRPCRPAGRARRGRPRRVHAPRHELALHGRARRPLPARARTRAATSHRPAARRLSRGSRRLRARDPVSARSRARRAERRPRPGPGRARGNAPRGPDTARASGRVDVAPLRRAPHAGEGARRAARRAPAAHRGRWPLRRRRRRRASAPRSRGAGVRDSRPLRRLSRRRFAIPRRRRRARPAVALRGSPLLGPRSDGPRPPDRRVARRRRGGGSRHGRAHGARRRRRGARGLPPGPARRPGGARGPRRGGPRARRGGVRTRTHARRDPGDLRRRGGNTGARRRSPSREARVVIVSTDYGPPWNEGEKNIAHVLDRRLRDHGWQPTVCSNPWSDVTASSRHRPSAVKLARAVRFWVDVGRSARRDGAALIHLLTSVSSALGLKCRILRRAAGVPLLLHATGLARPVRGYRRLLEYDAAVVGGSYLLPFFPDAVDLPPLSPHVNARLAADARAAAPAAPGGRLVYLGHMEPERGVHTLVEALGQLAGCG